MALRNVRHSARTQKLLGIYVLGGGGKVMGWVKLTRIFIQKYPSGKCDSSTDVTSALCVCVCVLGPSYAIIWNCRQKQLWILPCLSCDRDRPLSSSCWWETLLYSGVSPFLLSAWLILGCGTSYQH